MTGLLPKVAVSKAVPQKSSRFLIINISGTNGSGKTTLIKNFMAKCVSVYPIYGVVGAKKPEAYRCVLKGASASVFILGPYNVPTGGVDYVQPYSLIVELVNKYITLGHVLMEGVLASGVYGQLYGLMKEHKNSILLFMPTSLEECIKRTKARRQGRGNERELDPTNMTTKYKGLLVGRKRVEKEGILPTDEASLDKILGLLRNA